MSSYKWAAGGASWHMRLHQGEAGGLIYAGKRLGQTDNGKIKVGGVWEPPSTPKHPKCKHGYTIVQSGNAMLAPPPTTMASRRYE